MVPPAPGSLCPCALGLKLESALYRVLLAAPGLSVVRRGGEPAAGPPETWLLGRARGAGSCGHSCRVPRGPSVPCHCSHKLRSLQDPQNHGTLSFQGLVAGCQGGNVFTFANILSM